MDVSKIWMAWPVQGPCSLTPLTGGTNNHVWRMDAADGQSYTLRVAPNATHIPRMRYEASVLQALSLTDLPFLLPVPIPALNGDILVPVIAGDASGPMATLAAFLPGARSELSTPERAHEAGAALALLDRALVSLSVASPPADARTLLPFGYLAERNPLLPDLVAALEQLPVGHELIQQLQTTLIQHLAGIDELYATLPQQLLHRDLDPSNLLIDEHGVTAILDFEFAATDIRVLDLSVSLSWWPVSRMGTGTEWEIIDPLGQAYISIFPLTETELAAIPAMMRMRQFASLQHRIGRYLSGLEQVETIQEVLEFAQWRFTWLANQQHTLIEHALGWQRISS
ncbi:hypothetical protein KDA_68810 [Dictyobacter alpinus]|uniref:Aminoglycoside phosphotransferase domain-containing protein n=1 Tax=Dictyobacter alpinus TaxID=2014873 RepID=A0A402BJ95_9CHLR|nr:phosphotransferase [Dictyobacter alpinus]GCE31397.1 hypothetical protein KDA_68810 [Dictyobacter alpinus]